jgi:hypothetical protein
MMFLVAVVDQELLKLNVTPLLLNIAQYHSVQEILTNHYKFETELINAAASTQLLQGAVADSV